MKTTLVVSIHRDIAFWRSVRVGIGMIVVSLRWKNYQLDFHHVCKSCYKRIMRLRKRGRNGSWEFEPKAFSLSGIVGVALKEASFVPFQNSFVAYFSRGVSGIVPRYISDSFTLDEVLIKLGLAERRRKRVDVDPRQLTLFE